MHSKPLKSIDTVEILHYLQLCRQTYQKAFNLCTTCLACPKVAQSIIMALRSPGDLQTRYCAEVQGALATPLATHGLAAYHLWQQAINLPTHTHAHTLTQIDSEAGKIAKSSYYISNFNTKPIRSFFRAADATPVPVFHTSCSFQVPRYDSGEDDALISRLASINRVCNMMTY